MFHAPQAAASMTARKRQEQESHFVILRVSCPAGCGRNPGTTVCICMADSPRISMRLMNSANVWDDDGSLWHPVLEYAYAGFKGAGPIQYPPSRTRYIGKRGNGGRLPPAC